MPRLRLVLLAALLAAACSQFSIKTNHDERVDFSRFKTYAWLPLEEAAPADQRVLDRYIDTRIRKAVDRELGAKGYRPAASAAPDFLLNYRLATEVADSVKGDPGRYFRGAYWGGWPGIETFYRESYDEGSLFMAVIDGSSKQMVWLGAAQARLLPHISLEARAKRVDEAVHQILEGFPPK